MIRDIIIEDIGGWWRSDFQTGKERDATRVQHCIFSGKVTQNMNDEEYPVSVEDLKQDNDDDEATKFLQTNHIPLLYDMNKLFNVNI